MPQSNRLYYADSFLRNFTARVTHSRSAEREDGEPIWQVVLDQTAFYPTSGGQPFDTGLLLATVAGEPPQRVRVEQVEEDEEGTVWHFVPQMISPGITVEAQIDWERRFDHMQQHTGQHLLSAVFLSELNLPTVSFHLGETVSTIDLAGDVPTQKALERVERIANATIAEDRAVSVRSLSRDEADRMLSAGELRKLPNREGLIRLIEIADCDQNACGGTHVRSTGQIGAVLLRGTEKVSRGARIEFVCGARAIRAARTDASILTETSRQLSTAAADLPDAVGRLLSESKAAAKQRQKLREELAMLHGASLAGEAEAQNGFHLLVREWKDRDREYVKLLASRTAAARPGTVVIFSSKEVDPARVFLARSADLNLNCGTILREELAAMNLRGGGSPDLAQGDIPADKEPGLRASLLSAIRSTLSTAQ